MMAYQQNQKSAEGWQIDELLAWTAVTEDKGKCKEFQKQDFIQEFAPEHLHKESLMTFVNGELAPLVSTGDISFQC